MAVAPTHLTTNGDTANLSAYATASVTPTTGRWVCIDVLVSGSGTAPSVSGVSGCGLTWVEITPTVLGPGNAKRLCTFRAMGTASAGVITITLSGAATGCAWSVYELAGTDTSGTNGSGAVVQSKTGSGTATSGSVTLDTAVTAGNATVGAFGILIQETMTPGSGYSQIGQGGHASPQSTLQTEFRADGQTVVNSTWTSSVVWCGRGIEIKPFAAAQTLGVVTGTGTVQPLGKVKSRALGLVAGVGTVHAITARTAQTLGTVTGTGTVHALNGAKVRTLGTVAGTGTVHVLASGRSQTLGTVTETGSVRPLVAAVNYRDITVSARALPPRFTARALPARMSATRGD